MILKLLMLCRGEWEVPSVRAREWISVTSWGRSCRDREMRSVAVPNMLRRVLCLTQTKWMALYSRSE
jgi:hypothetical protein